MKTWNLFFFLFFSLLLNVQALNAQSVKDVFKRDVPLTYLGIDFTHTRFFGPTPDLEATGVTFFVKSVNRLVNEEEKKYDFRLSFDKNSVVHNVEVTEALNKTVDEKNFVTNNMGDLNKLTSDNIQSIVSKYNLTGLSGLGLVFIPDNLNKEKGEAWVWVTIIDISSKKVLLAEKMKGGAGGAGIRNFWARPFYEILVEIREKAFESWRLKYG